MTLIFVFGSNTAGRHGKGAALAARKYHGAVYGVGEGLTGRSYAVPTCDGNFNPLPLPMINAAVQRFLTFARDNPNIGFKVTRVGCGLAYYQDQDIAPMFAEAPEENVFFDLKWKPYLQAASNKEFEYWGTY